MTFLKGNDGEQRNSWTLNYRNMVPWDHDTSGVGASDHPSWNVSFWKGSQWWRNNLVLGSFGENHVEACPYKVDPTSFTFPWILLHLLIYRPYPSSRDRDPRCTLSLYPSVGTFSRIQGGVTAMNISRFNGPSVGPYTRLVMIGKSLRDKKKNNPQIIPANRNALPLKLSTHRRITGAEAQF